MIGTPFATLCHDHTLHENRYTPLEGANIKLASVVSDVTGVSARAMLAELVAGHEDGAMLAQLAKGRLRAKQAELARALTGQMSAHQRFMLTQHLCHIDGLDTQIAAVSAAIAERLAPFETELVWLDSVTGVGRWSAEVILAEIGTDMSRFPTAGHLSSWAGMCPGQDESAGKRRSGKTRKGSPWLRVTLTECAYAAGRSKDTDLADRYHRLIARRGKKKAAVAVGRMILERCYIVLSAGQIYDDQQARAQTAQRRDREEQRLVHRLERLGHQVTRTPAA